MPIMTQVKYLQELHAAYDEGQAQGVRDAEFRSELRATQDAAAIADLQRILKLRTAERDAAMKTLDEALLLVEALFARQNELALAMGKEPPFLEDLKVIREILNGEGRAVT